MVFQSHNSECVEDPFLQIQSHMENAEYLLVKVCPQLLISKKRACYLVMVIFYAMLPCWITFQTKNSIRDTPLALHPSKSCTEAIMRALQIITSMVVEKGMEHKGEKKYVNFGSHDASIGAAAVGSQDEATLNSASPKP